MVGEVSAARQQSSLFSASDCKDLIVEDPKRGATMHFQKVNVPLCEGGESIDFGRLLRAVAEEEPLFTATFGIDFTVRVWHDLAGRFEELGVSSSPSQLARLRVGDFRNAEKIYVRIEGGREQPKKRKQRRMSKEKRIKERAIEEVRQLVADWRALHQESAGKLNLDQVAGTVGVSRKTLDDYSLQLRRAAQLGFNFDEHKDKKMGYLRNFVNSRALNNQTQNTLGATEKNFSLQGAQKKQQNFEKSSTAACEYETASSGGEEDLNGSVTPSTVTIVGCKGAGAAPLHLLQGCEGHQNNESEQLIIRSCGQNEFDVDDFLNLEQCRNSNQQLFNMLGASFNADFMPLQRIEPENTQRQQLC